MFCVSYQLIAGAHEIRNLNLANVQTRTISSVFPYDTLPKQSLLKHDLAILKTSAPFQINQFVRMISLPIQGFQPKGKNVSCFMCIVLSLFRSIGRNEEKQIELNQKLFSRFFDSGLSL